MSNPITTVSDGKTSIHFTKDDIDGDFTELHLTEVGF